jgi:ribosomal protein L36
VERAELIDTNRTCMELEDKDIRYAKKKKEEGATDKIIRRNKKIWDRVINKRRRALDREAIEVSEKESEE